MPINLKKLICRERKLFFLFILFLNSCIKTDFQENRINQLLRQEKVVTKFLRPPVNATNDLLYIIDDLKEKEKKQPFIFEFSVRNGIPKWEDAVGTTPAILIKSPSNSTHSLLTIGSEISTNSTNKSFAFFIPLLDTNSNEVRSYIFCQKSQNGTTFYNTFNKESIINSHNTSDKLQKGVLLSVFAFFEKKINKKNRLLIPPYYQYQNVDFNFDASYTSSQLKFFKEVKNLGESSLNTIGGCAEGFLTIDMAEVAAALPGGGVQSNPCINFLHFRIICNNGTPTFLYVGSSTPCAKEADGGPGYSVDYFWLGYLPLVNNPEPPSNPESGGNTGVNPSNGMPPNFHENSNLPWFNIRERIGNQSSPLSFDPENPFDNLWNVVEAPDDPIIENGIDATEALEELTTFMIPTYRLLGSTNIRGNTEDTTYGTNGDATGINQNYMNMSNEQLFIKMNDLFAWCTILNKQTLGEVAKSMISKFRDGPQLPPFSHEILNQEVSRSSEIINFAKEFGQRLNNSLRLVNGDISLVGNIAMGDIRPKFNNLKHLFGGLKILVNDTEATKVYLKNYKLNPQGNWEADLIFEIEDHFGLDKNDALKYQNKHGGFAAWWVLQHRRNYKPFITKIHVVKKIKGTL